MIERRKLTVADFLLMGELGVFAPDKRLELLDGEIYTMSPPSSKHAAWVDRVMKALERRYGERTIVRVQSPVKLSEDSSPEPDVAVLMPRTDFYEAELPSAGDVLLTVEFSLSTLSYDRTRKLLAYAAARIEEYWIVNLEEGQLEVYCEPVNRRYRVRLSLGLGEAATPVAIPKALPVVF